MTAQLLIRIAWCVEKGKIDLHSPHPADMKGEEGADELTHKALASGADAQDILSQALIPGMQAVGQKFRNNEIYLPDVLMSARAMGAAMEYLKPHFKTGDIQYRGKIVLGTVAGDLHDIGKKIVAMFFEGGGWEVIDCGVDVSEPQFQEAIQEFQPDAVGMSALLTTTMVNMEEIVRGLKTKFPKLLVIVGGAPVTDAFAARIGADFYSPDPQGALEKLNSIR